MANIDFNDSDIYTGTITQGMINQWNYAFNQIDKKQNSLVSTENIKTINGASILGSGNILIETGGQVEGNGNGSNVTQSQINNWNQAFNKMHTHDNKSVLDDINTVNITKWNNASTSTHTHTNKNLLDNILGFKTINNISIIRSKSSDSDNIEIAGNGTVQIVNNLIDGGTNKVLSAEQGKTLKTLIDNIDTGVKSVSITGSGNNISNVSWNSTAKTLTFTKSNISEGSSSNEETVYSIEATQPISIGDNLITTIYQHVIKNNILISTSGNTGTNETNYMYYLDLSELPTLNWKTVLVSGIDTAATKDLSFGGNKILLLCRYPVPNGVNQEYRADIYESDDGKSWTKISYSKPLSHTGEEIVMDITGIFYFNNKYYIRTAQIHYLDDEHTIESLPHSYSYVSTDLRTWTEITNLTTGGATISYRYNNLGNNFYALYDNTVFSKQEQIINTGDWNVSTFINLNMEGTIYGIKSNRSIGKSTDLQNWTILKEFNSNILKLIEVSSKYLVAFVQDDCIWISVDKGTTWKRTGIFSNSEYLNGDAYFSYDNKLYRYSYKAGVVVDTPTEDVSYPGDVKYITYTLTEKKVIDDSFPEGTIRFSIYNNSPFGEGYTLLESQLLSNGTTMYIYVKDATN